MAEKGATKSKYALKRERGIVGVSNTRPRRVCDVCKLSLVGPKGHGFVSRSGRKVGHASCLGYR